MDLPISELHARECVCSDMSTCPATLPCTEPPRAVPAPHTSSRSLLTWTSPLSTSTRPAREEEEEDPREPPAALECPPLTLSLSLSLALSLSLSLSPTAGSRRTWSRPLETATACAPNSSRRSAAREAQSGVGGWGVPPPIPSCPLLPPTPLLVLQHQDGDGMLEGTPRLARPGAPARIQQQGRGGWRGGSPFTPLHPRLRTGRLLHPLPLPLTTLPPHRPSRPRRPSGSSCWATTPSTTATCLRLRPSSRATASRRTSQVSPSRSPSV